MELSHYYPKQGWCASCPVRLLPRPRVPGWKDIACFPRACHIAGALYVCNSQTLGAMVKPTALQLLGWFQS